MREIRMLRLMRQGMETWPMPWRHSLTLPEGGASGNRTFLPLYVYWTAGAAQSPPIALRQSPLLWAIMCNPHRVKWMFS